MRSFPRVLPLALALVVLAIFARPARASLITGTFTDVGDSDHDLTALGAADWAYWNTTSSPAAGTPTNRKSGGTLIGAISPVGGGNTRGSSSGTRPLYDFTFTDGTAPVSGTVDNVIGLFNTQLNMPGAGVSLGVTLPTAAEYIVYVWAAGFGAGQGTLTATLPGAANFVNTQLSAPAAASKRSVLYTLRATPNTAGDTLGVSLVLSSSTDANGHVLISGGAAALAPPPPPPPTYFAYDGFSYPTGDLNGQAGGTGWANPWAATSVNEQVRQPTPPLQYAIPGGGLVDGGDRALAITGNTDPSLATRSLDDAFSGNDVYISFLLRWAAGTVGQNDFVAIYFGSSTGPSIGVKGNMDTGTPSNPDFFVRTTSNNAYFGNITDDSTYFIVGHLLKNGSGNYNQYELWVNPDYGDVGSPNVVSTIADSGLSSFSFLGIRSLNLDSGEVVYIDELRLGTTWDEVMNTSFVPEPGTMLLLVGGLVGLLRRRARAAR